MKCDYCHGNTVSRRVTKHHWLRGRLYVVENVAAEVCKDCGERYYHAKVLDAIDRFLERAHPVKQSLQVEVVSLEASPS
jgi:YgiT-type zinc finger domain-containing protein